MTQVDTDTLAGLLADATPGPWMPEEKTGPISDWARANIGVWSPHRLAQSTAADDGDDPMDDAWLCGIWGDIGDEDMANARLIALAPELAAETIALRAQTAKDKARIERLEAALRWYGEQARLARLIHSEGDAGRNALARDGGEYARAALEDLA